jgi:hypothetical protein
VVRKTTDSGTTLIVDDRNPLDNDAPCYTGGEKAVWSEILSDQDMKNWFDGTTANRRQRLVTAPPLYAKLSDAVADLEMVCVPLKDLAEVTGFGWSAQDLQKANIMVNKDVIAADGQQILPVFFQAQARVGKPVDYRQFRTTASLSHQALLDPRNKLDEKVLRLGKRVGGVWISQAIDRFPLVFTQDPSETPSEWIGVSKYLHAQPKGLLSQRSDVLSAALTSTPVLLMMDRFLKEGTRKTLRTNENGFAKEIRKQDVEELLVPNLALWPASTLDRISALQAKRGTVSLHRFDDALKNKEWLEIDALIMEALGFDANEQAALQNLASALYWRRMRNILVYGEKQRILL